MINLSYKEKFKCIIIIAVLIGCMLTLCGCTAGSTEVTWQVEKSTAETAFSEDGVPENEVQADLQTQDDMQICVYVCGAVNKPGIYTISDKSRLYEAVELAGGMTEQADATYLNLARELKDGEQIVVYTIEETADIKQTDSGNSQSADLGLVNINTASAQELTQLKGIGESRAEAIVKYRDTYGRFNSIEEIKNVTGIKEGLYEKIRNKITVG